MVQAVPQWGRLVAGCKAWPFDMLRLILEDVAKSAKREVDQEVALFS